MPEPRSLELVATCGIPFAGKTTLARELAARRECALVSVDAIVAERGIDLGADAGNQAGWARAMAEGLQRVRGHLAAGEPVVYDTANHTRRNRDRCRRVARQHGAAFRCIWLDVPVAVARERQLANRANPHREDVPDAAFREIVEQFEPPLDEPDVVRVTPGMGLETFLQRLS